MLATPSASSALVGDQFGLHLGPRLRGRKGRGRDGKGTFGEGGAGEAGDEDRGDDDALHDGFLWNKLGVRTLPGLVVPGGHRRDLDFGHACSLGIT
jgi:hypothetical protein